jgi:hypothetical protein
MNKLISLLAAVACALLLATGMYAQRSRTVSDPQKTEANTPATPAPAPAPETVKAKYEGGVVGYLKKQDGTLKFDDANHRLVFRDKFAREYFPIPYGAITALYPETHSVQPTSARVIGAMPTPYGIGMLSMLARKKVRYMIVQYNDPDTKASGVTSFKLDNKEMVLSVINTLAQKSELTQRGEAYVRTDKASATP